MPYDEYLAERINQNLERRGVAFISKKMMGGLCYMVQDKMICGPIFQKKINEQVLMVRIGEESSLAHSEHPACLPMDFTGRPMKGYLFVRMCGLDREDELDYWLNLCLKFNDELTKKEV